MRISELVEDTSVPDREEIGKIGNDKKAIQNEKSLRRSILTKITLDDLNGWTSIRVDRLDVR